MRPIVSDVAWSVCLLVTTVSATKQPTYSRRAVWDSRWLQEPITWGLDRIRRRGKRNFSGRASPSPVQSKIYSENSACDRYSPGKFGRWQQRCGLSLAVLRQFDATMNERHRPTDLDNSRDWQSRWSVYVTTSWEWCTGVLYPTSHSYELEHWPSRVVSDTQSEH